GDYQYGHQVTHGDTVGGATGHDQFYIGSGQDSHEFEVPVRLGLDLYADEGSRPTERFGQDPVPAQAPPAPGAPSAPPVPGPPTVAGALRLAVPHGRTRAPSPNAAPATPASRRDGVPRRPDATDHARLDGTDATGTPRPEVVRVPDDALIDTVRGSAAVETAFQRAAGDIRRETATTPPTAAPAGGPVLPVTAPNTGTATTTAAATGTPA
ncbi:hypothetical protein NGM37_34870, partial [Streptomyces sp. TRM76130]|nr:hypothetical protein [Streptomyces sp. TRM76130]